MTGQALRLAEALIARPSVTPDDAGCQELIAELLGQAGFKTERLRFGAVDNLWARRGNAAPALARKPGWKRSTSTPL